MPQAVIRNYRDADLYVGHESAIIWAILTRADGEGDSPPHACLQHMSGFARHSLQGHKNSDYHQHEGAEQFYYVLTGSGEVLIGDQRYPVSEGSVTYFPPETPHQFFAEDTESGCEHLIITCPVERSGSEPRVLNWRDASPSAGVHGGAVTWNLLESIDEEEPSTERPCLLGFYYLARQALLRGKASDYHKHDDKEQVYYILEGTGSIMTGSDVHPIAEGDTVYLPRGVCHQIINEDCDGWLTYLVIS